MAAGVTVAATVAATARSPLSLATAAVVAPRQTSAPRMAVRVAVVSGVMAATVASTVAVLRVRRLVPAVGLLTHVLRLRLSAVVGTQIESRTPLRAGDRIRHVQ